ncbi:MAG TPA: hypothetical protein VGS08_05735 [Candidatus Saccharimonadales bacterium]|nr:hypothetical protein [Candidatus Saccharimonadales bacterium]
MALPICRAGTSGNDYFARSTHSLSWALSLHGGYLALGLSAPDYGTLLANRSNGCWVWFTDTTATTA